MGCIFTEVIFWTLGFWAKIFIDYLRIKDYNKAIKEFAFIHKGELLSLGGVMLFNSYEFIFLFLPITLIIYFTLNRYGKNNIAKGWLVIASLYFYSYFHLSYLYLILSSIMVNYFIGNKLNHKSLTGRERKI